MALSNAVVQLRLQLVWSASEASSLRHPIEEHLLPLFAGPAFTRGTVVQRAGYLGADGLNHLEQQMEYTEAGGWLEALSQPSPSYVLRVSQGTVTSLELNITTGSITVQMRAPEEKGAELRERLASFTQATGLKPFEKSPVFVPVTGDIFRKSGSYRLIEDATKEQLLHAAEQIVAWLQEAGEIQFFTGTLSIKSAHGVIREIRPFEAWKEAVSKAWEDAENIGISLTRPGRTADLKLQLADRVLLLNLSATANDALIGISASLADTLTFTSLLAAPSGETRVETRNYYITEAVTATWVKTFMSTIEKVTPRSISFGGNFRIADRDYAVRDFAAWKKEAEQRWNEMQFANCWISFQDSRHNFEIDFERELLKVNLSINTGDKSPVTSFGDFTGELKLEPAPANPYLYYRFARTFVHAEAWMKGTDRKLADAIESAIVKAFGGRRYRFVTGFVIEGAGAEEQTSLPNVASFLEKLRDVSLEYVSARIYLQGPLGTDLNVFLERKEKKVVVRSSTEKAGNFKEIVKPFNDINLLELIKSEDRTKPTAEPQKSRPLLLWIGGIATVMLSGVVTFFVNNLPARKNTLEVISPHDAQQVEGRSCRLLWAVNHVTPFGQTSDTPTAHVFVSKEGDSSYRNDQPAASSGMLLEFPADGTYDIMVSLENVEPKNTRIIVKTSPLSSPETLSEKKN